MLGLYNLRVKLLMKFNTSNTSQNMVQCLMNKMYGEKPAGFILEDKMGLGDMKLTIANFK